MRCEIVKSYIEWRKRNDKDINEHKDAKDILEYLSKCQHVFSANIWTQTGNGVGYYGINLNLCTFKTPKKLYKDYIRSISMNEFLGLFSSSYQ